MRRVNPTWEKGKRNKEKGRNIRSKNRKHEQKNKRRDKETGVKLHGVFCEELENFWAKGEPKSRAAVL